MDQGSNDYTEESFKVAKDNAKDAFISARKSFEKAVDSVKKHMEERSEDYDVTGWEVDP